jgi:hypothetical protein
MHFIARSVGLAPVPTDSLFTRLRYNAMFWNAGHSSPQALAEAVFGGLQGVIVEDGEQALRELGVRPG